MIRLFSIAAMAAAFLMISPGLRGTLSNGYTAVLEILNDTSPWSYLVIGVVIFALLTSELYRHALPKHKRVKAEDY